TDQRAAGGCRDDVANVRRVRVSQRRQDEGRDERRTEDRQVAEAEYDVPDQPDEAVLADLAQVQPGDPGQRQSSHHHLQRAPYDDLGRGDRGDVEVWVADLDADEDQSGGGRGGAGGPGQCGGR